MREMNQALTERVLAELRNVIRDLGRDGGSMTPSVYETAQVLRFCPEIVEADKVVDWLLRQQQPDGGWGEVEAPLYRTVPTLAAILALHDYSSHERVRHACFLGQRFLEEQDTVIKPADGEYLPVAIELILPRLLEEADERGIFLSRTRFRHLEDIGVRRRNLIAAGPQSPNSPAFFSWEAWGTSPEQEFVGTVGGVGHSPAATAWWLRLNAGRKSTSATRAREYITDASRASGCRIRGVVPAPWPMNRFEQSFVLHIVEMAGLLRHHGLARETSLQLADLRHALAKGSLGFSDHFAPDGDDTAAAIAVLAAAGIDVDYSLLSPFERAQHFVAYPFEMHISYAVTARATQALNSAGRDVTSWRNCIVMAQQPDGWWLSEKWNRSRLYGTMLALAALDDSADQSKISAAQAFLKYQHNDGGWGCFGGSTPVETALAVLTLHKINIDASLRDACIKSTISACRYLHRTHSIHSGSLPRMWIGKDLYSARRVDNASTLCAILISSVASQPSPYVLALAQ